MRHGERNVLSEDDDADERELENIGNWKGGNKKATESGRRNKRSTESRRRK